MNIFTKKDFALANNYLNNPNLYIREHKVRINGKIRLLRAYIENNRGAELQKLHEKIALFLQKLYVSASSSFAYKKNTNIVDCVKQHLNGKIFLKSDIHSYFDSITYAKFLKVLNEQNILPENSDKILELLKACFYEDKLPLGFSSSPIISDLYLNELDKKFEKNQNYTYTRYADDFIISSIDENSERLLKQVREELWDDVEMYGLELNEKKTYIRKLESSGDAIHVLGLNLVLQEDSPNRITVSDKYLRETCKELAEYITSKTNEKFAEIKGKISFIKMASLESYQKFKKISQIKLNINIEELF